MSIMVVDDEDLIRWSLKDLLIGEGYDVTEAKDGKTALATVDREVPELILLDMRLPDMDGLTILKNLQARARDIPVIVITAFSSIGTAVEAMKAGAFDYVVKPFDMDQLVVSVRQAIETGRLRRRVRDHVQEKRAAFGLHNLLGNSKPMRDVRGIVQKLVKSPATTVLLRGESGTGKCIIAKALHCESPRADHPFMNITCTALQDTLLESELFGHEKGAFTDAKTQKKGLFELADGGTVFLDEIGDMSVTLQSKLLRFLEERQFRRVGGSQDIKVDVRVVAATNGDLEKLIEDKRFRRDLYYRLNTLTISVAPLRERKEDIPLLVEHFLGVFAAEFRLKRPVMADDAMRKLQAHPWYGNVRELKHVLERAVLLSSGPTISAEDIILGPVANPPEGEEHAIPVPLPQEGVDFDKIERELLVQALEQTRGNQTRASRLLNMTRNQVHYRMQKYGLLAPRFPRPTPVS
ncbi:MAG: sigma-54-dependent Fis family transcriptional regulator [Planctomycetes bacterium]|nr:sigma-54-dependent Fis family transcriptional regulator [Planctomycetota bacterium]